MINCCLKSGVMPRLFSVMRFIFLLAIAATLVQCQVPAEQGTQQPVQISSAFRELDDGYNVYVIGDWGRNGQYGQKELAITMNEATRQVEPEFIISTGDNFYHNGVASVNDPYWLSSFENVYDGADLFCDWYVVLGNHDYRGNAQAQIDYTQVSRRWNMPARYFLKDVTEEGTTARFVFIDTSPLNDEYHQEAKYKDKVSSQDTTAQLVWMDSVLNVEVDYKIVVGHHPLYTGGKRAEDEMFVRKHVEPLLDKYQVDLYLAGHEHDLQHLKVSDKLTHHVVSGAGSEVRPTGKTAHTLFAAAESGFFSLSFNQDEMLCQFLNVEGQVLHEFLIKP